MNRGVESRLHDAAQPANVLQEEPVALTRTDHISEAVYRQLAIQDDYALVELYRGYPREKPPMSVGHGDVMGRLLRQLFIQVDDSAYQVRVQHARLRLSSDTYFIPDIAIVPNDQIAPLRQRPVSLDAYKEPLPLVIEIWSPSTGTYDVTEKLAAYLQRGDQEIWSIHPYARTLTSWVRQLDGTYNEVVRLSGLVTPSRLTGVGIDIGLLFAT
jgi:Uma2 family endonuclease